ncbi:MAG: MotA/TolQ/ExbB proton channel family protein [Deltaproteobacteria bacterium]|nr:MotA/TolQ/ExbB proton channel family protein [Deltaproteobacteria bacterium]
MEFSYRFFHAFNSSESGYVFMWILLLSGIVAMAIVIERLAFLTLKSGKRSASQLDNVISVVAGGDMKGGLALCAGASKKAVFQVLENVLASSPSGSDQVQNVVDESMLKVIPHLEKRTTFLATIGNIATLIGLMGTIYGLILSFSAVGKPGIDAVEKSTLLASGIAAAMSTTFMGLLVAIPSIGMYAYLKSKTQMIVDEIDLYTLKLSNALLISQEKRVEKNYDDSSRV